MDIVESAWLTSLSVSKTVRVVRRLYDDPHGPDALLRTCFPAFVNEFQARGQVHNQVLPLGIVELHLLVHQAAVGGVGWL